MQRPGQLVVGVLRATAAQFVARGPHDCVHHPSAGRIRVRDVRSCVRAVRWPVHLSRVGHQYGAVPQFGRPAVSAVSQSCRFP